MPPSSDGLQWGAVYRSTRVWHLGLVYIAYGLSYMIYMTFFVKALTQTIAVGMIAGVVRLLRRPGAALYGWFCLFYSAMLLIWHYPPNERFVLPMFPLLLAGLGT